MKARILVAPAVAIALLVAAACVPISPDPGGIASGDAVSGSTIPEIVPTLDYDGAVATVATPSLRVRSLPSGTAPLLGALKSGEQYQVLSRSSDGGWLELAIPQIARGSGWVSASLVSVNGDITDTPISAVPEAAPAATVVPEPAAVPTIAPTEVPTEVPTEEPTVVPTEVPTEEPTSLTPTEVPTEEPTAVPTEAPTEVPTEVPTEEPTATPETFVLPTPTPQPAEPTAVPAEEPAGDAGESAPVYPAPAAGFATVIAEPRLRVRSAPSTDGEIVGFGYPGETFQVLATSEDGLWTQIAGSAESAENPNGGWVSTEFLLFGQ
jgi:uncharacterized protein YgiM (DUF1202 family)